MAQLTGGQAIVQSLKRHGIDTMFVLPGIQLDNIFDALYDEQDHFKLFHTRHEQACSYMADGFARTTGKPGVCLVVPGPGLLNAMAGLSTAYACSAPVLAISGQIQSDMIGVGRGLLHEIPEQLQCVASVTKWAKRIETPEDAPSSINEAFVQMLSGRPRPVEVEMAPDIMGLKGDVQLLDPSAIQLQAPDTDQIRAAAKALANAKKPMIFVGGGIFDATEELLALAEMLQAPVVMSNNGKGAIDARNYLAHNGLTGKKLWKDTDVVLAVGTRANLERFRLIVGSEVEEDLRQMPSAVSSRRVVVTHRDVLGKTLTALALRHKYGVTVTRVTRADLEMTAVPDLKLQFGDMLQLVGREEDVARGAALLGNSARALNQTNILAIFVGIALGVVAGLLPIEISGLPVPLRLGLAGGPLIVAILISRLGHIGPIIWHMPLNANIAMRELGLTLFLACVGLKSGERFLTTLSKGDGFLWMACGLAVTLVPVLAGGIVGRLVLKLDFASLSGILAGSYTDPPALAFATDLNKSDTPNVAYATVYPMTLLLRILLAQVLTIVLCAT